MIYLLNSLECNTPLMFSTIGECEIICDLSVQYGHNISSVGNRLAFFLAKSNPKSAPNFSINNCKHLSDIQNHV